MKNSLKVIGIGLFVVGLLVSGVFGQGSSTPQNRGSNGNADKNLKSVARINPSTLAMEMNVSLAEYPGRKGNSLPVGISYSSKLWQMDSGTTYWYQQPYSCNLQYVTQLNPLFAERSAAGWTSSIAFPVIEEKLDFFDENGKPYDFGIGEPLFNNVFQSAVTTSQSLLTQNLLPSPVACGLGCDYYWCEPSGGSNNQHICTCQAWTYHYCEGGGGGGGCGGGNGNPGTQQMFNIKRVYVRMGDGSTHEFRKSDAVFEGSTADNIGTFLSVDGSGMRLERTETGSTLYTSNGGQFKFPSTSTSGYDGKALYQATEMVDIDGNKTMFSDTIVDNRPVRKITDTMGREVVDILPKNFHTQEQVEGKREIPIPGLSDNSQQYELKWLHLKPVVCDGTNTGNCGNPEGALENQNENLYYYTSNTCFGSYYGNLLVNPNNPYDPANNVMFPMNGLGLRSCNPFTGDTPQTSIGTRFNPVVLAEVKLPNDKKYIFKYNQYGEISKIIYPTGSYETFKYEKIAPLSGFSETAYDQTNRGVTERRVYRSNGDLEQRWKYNANFNPNSNIYKVTTTAPKGNDPLADGAITEKYLYSSHEEVRHFGFENPLGGMPFEEKIYDENHVLRSRSLTDYTYKSVLTGSYLSPNITTAYRDARSTRSVTFTFDPSGQGNALATFSKTEYDQTGSTVASDFSHLNVKSAKSYDYEVVPTGTALSVTDWNTIEGWFASKLDKTAETDYDYSRNDYKAIGINSLPTESRVKYKNETTPISVTKSIFDEPQYLVPDSDALSGDASNTWTNPGTLRGKATTSQVLDATGNVLIETHTQYDQYGNVRKTFSPSGVPNVQNVSEVIYSTEYACAYPTKTISPAPSADGIHGTTETSESTTTYDFTTGLPLTVTDEYNQTIQTEYDAYLRPKKVSGVYPFVIPITETFYDDVNLSWVKVRKQIDENNWDEATTFSDSLGRTIKTQAKDSQGDVFTETKYDNLGRVAATSNPYRIGETIYWSKPRYDELNRVVETFAPAIEGQTGASLGITEFGISTVQDFVGTYTTATDASGRKARSITNALGQLIRIDEPKKVGENIELGDIDQPLQPTFYKYNAQGKMVHVIQGKTGEVIQNRYFLYDYLGRLIRVKQPEQEVNETLNTTQTIDNNSQWTAGFEYDLVGNLKKTTDAKGSIITNSYDKAGRVFKRTYSNEPQGVTTPNVEYFYDGKGLTNTPDYAKGHITKVTSSISESRYTNFDNFGRLLQMEQRTPFDTETIANATPRVSSYQYDFGGRLIAETYPSGRVVKNEFNADGDLSRIASKSNATAIERQYASGFGYTADGKIQRLKLGSGVWESAKFDSRFQVTEMSLGTSNDNGNLWKLNYEYGEIDENGNTNTTKNIGNISKQIISYQGLAQPFVQSFKYDALNRITEAKENSGTINGTQNWKQTFDYDRFGNRTSFNQIVGTEQITINNQTLPSVDAASNRFNLNQGYIFDKNGNIIQDNASGLTRNFTFNADNKQTEVKNINDVSIGKYFYDGEGNRVKKVTQAETTIFVYSNGKLVAEYSTATPPTDKQTRYFGTDQLVTPRVITNQNGQVISRRDYMPFGEEISINRPTNDKYGVLDDGVRQGFTNYEKDKETDLDFAEARMYNNRHGRFTTVDPLLASGKSANPQTFNRYVYTMNRPTVLSDPSGMQTTSRTKIHIEKPCKIGSSGCNPVNLGVVDVIWNSIADAIETTVSSIADFTLNYDQFENLNAERYENEANAMGGDPEAGEFLLNRRVVGNKGPAFGAVMETATESKERALYIGEKNIQFQMFYLQFNPINLGFAASSPTVTTNRGISLSSSNPFARASIAKEEFARANPGLRRSAVVGWADTKSNLSGASTNTLEPPSVVGPKMQASANRLGGLGANVPGTRNRVGCCAEFNGANNAELRGANPNNLVFTRPARLRPSGGFIPVCTICQTWARPAQFPRGTEFK